MSERKEGWKNEWMKERKEGWMKGWMNEYGEWINECRDLFLLTHLWLITVGRIFKALRSISRVDRE